MMNLWWLFCAHFVFDWGLQDRFMAENKSSCVEVMFAHCMIYTADISAVLAYCNIFDWWKIVFIFTGHLVVDSVSSRMHKAYPVSWRKILYADHVAHFVQIVIVVIL